LSSKLDQLLGYLDRADVTEVIVGVGRPITIKMGQSYTPLTSLPVTELQFETLVGGTALDGIVKTARSEPVDCEIGRRRIRVEVMKRTDGNALRIQTVPAIDRTQAMEPIVTRTQAMEPIVTRTQPLEPVATRTQPIEPVVTRTQPMEPIGARTPIEPVATRTQAMEPVATRTQAMEPVATRTQPIEAPSRREADSLSIDPEDTKPLASSTKFAQTVAMPKVEPQPAAVSEPARDNDSAAVVVGEDDGLVEERVDVSGIAAYVRAARQAGASDLHIAANRAVQIRVMGELRSLDEGAKPVPGDIVDRVLLPLLGPRRRMQLRMNGYVDLAFDVQNGGRLRGNVSRQQGGLRGAFRLARVTPPTLDELGLPRELAKVVAHHQGLVVIAGPNGQGKTTTMAALVDIVNSTKPHHIITIEDPVELEHPRKLAVITQREVGRHTKSFAAALKASLREDPDVIVIGELRDRETVEIALTAAETGHLVLATMSTPSAAKTIDRLIDMFPPADQAQARASIAGALRAVIAQRLLPASRGNGVVPAVELVTGVLPLAVLIRDDKLYQLPNLMQRGRAFGMIRFEESLLELLRSGKITEDTVRQHSPHAAAQAKAQVTQAMGRVGRRE
jgi:twitching motility protein PilT